MAEELTPMMRQYRQAQQGLDDNTILFFRLGDFYEMFFDDAQRAAPILGVTITKRGGVPMCGIPYHAVEGYIAKAVQAGMKIAICEQVEDPKTTKGIVRREITRIITPGTLVEDAILDATANNFIASLYAHKNGTYGLAILDLSTGAFLAESCQDAAALTESVRRYAPSECLLSDEQSTLPLFIELHQLKVIRTQTITDGWRYLFDHAQDVLLRHFKVHSLQGFSEDAKAPWIQPAGALIHYVKEILHQDLVHLRSMTVRKNDDFLILDETTCANLDLLPHPGRTEDQTLLGVFSETKTAMGKRLLRSWLRSPLRQAEAICVRQDAVADLIGNRRMLNALRAALVNVRDLERLITRLCGNAGNARDLRALADSLNQIPVLSQILAPAHAELLQALARQLDPLPDLTAELLRAIVEAPPVTIKEGGIIADGYHAELDELRMLAHQGHTWIANYQADEQNRTGIKTLKVRRNNVFGFYIEVSKGQASQVPDDYERRQTLVNAERFITPILKEYEQKIFGAQDKANAIELTLFTELRSQAAAAMAAIQETAAALAQVDVLQCFADRALALSYIRPTVDTSDRLEIKEGRHPIVESQSFEERFVPNDTIMNGSDQQFLLITGPNMAGKSTYIRQVAILAILAHTGSYVPADAMTIGVIDRIFTRVGAGDDLARGRSTFMVEMQEAANILNNATAKSLIVLDEIGRGTSTFDGISIAWSVAEYLHNTPSRKARTLFATHYHELTDLATTLPGIKNYTVQVREQGDTIVFLRRIVPGAADKSYGIHVARLAGMPDPIINRATEILESLENQKLNQPKARIPKNKKITASTVDTDQMTFFDQL